LGLIDRSGTDRDGAYRRVLTDGRFDAIRSPRRIVRRGLISLACVATIVVGLFASTAGATGLIFSDGFESGNLSQWTGSSGVTVQQQVAYTGSWAARATSNGSAPAYAYKTLGIPLSELYYDGRVNLISEDGPANVSLVRFRTAAVGPILSIMRRSGNKLAYYNEVTGVTTTGPTVSGGAWHELKVHVLINGASSLVEVWLDGTRISALSKTDSLGATPVGRFYIGDPATGRSFDYAFDNVVLSTSSDISPPTAPANLTASAVGSLAVDLSWTASTDDIGVIGYTVYRNGSAIATVGGGTTTYHDASVVSGTTYTYVVDAFDAAGNHSPSSNSATITPVSDVQPPTTPTSLAATPVNPNRVDLTWNASVDNIGVTGYTVYRNGAQLDVTGGSTTSYSDTTASPATQYTYRVDAFDAAANHSAQSSPAVATTPSIPANSSPPTISGTAQVGQTLSADPGQWSGTSPITYTYQWRSCDQTGGGCTNIAGATSQAYVLGAGDVDTTLRVAVTGSNAFGSSAATSAATEVVIDLGPVPPSNTSPPTISGTPQIGQTLSADPGQWSGTSPITFTYQWRSCNQNGVNCSDIFGATAQTYTLTVLDLGNTVRVDVTASNSGGSSSATSTATAVVGATGPIPPSNTSPPTISGSATVGQTLSGDQGTWSGTEPITYTYQWRSCDQAGVNCQDISGATSQTYTLTPAEIGTTIRFAVTAVNDGGSSTATSSQTSIVVDSGPPAAPSNLAATAIGPNRIDLSWTASTDDVGVAGYTIYRAGSPIGTVSGTTTTYSDTTVSPSTTYTYTVDAFDAAQNHSAQSAPASATTPAPGDTTPPTTPTGLTASVITPTRVDLSWTPSTDNVGVAGYTVYRNGTVLANTGQGTTTYSDLSATANSTYIYQVDAFDAAGNHSPQSSGATVRMPGIVFGDGFESGNLSQWTGSSGVTVQQQVTYAGSWAARATSNGTTAAYAYKSLSTPLSELYYDGRFNVISQGSTTNASLVRFRTAAVGAILTILRRSDNKLAYYNEVTGVTTVGPTVSGGAWHELEVHVVINGSSGLIEVWLDGTRISALSKTDSLGTTPIGRLYIGDPATGRTFDYAFDNEVVSTAADVSPPTTPTGVAAIPIGSGRLNVTWNAAQDNQAVAGYTLYRNGNAIATLGPNTTGYANTGLSSSTTYSYTVDAFDGAGNRSAQSASVSATTGAPSSADPVIGTVGDIACDPGDTRFNGGVGTATACRQLATSNIPFSTDLAAVLPLGDNQYEDATQWKFLQSYDASWGRVFSLTHPVPGNHEYVTPGAAGYYAYFNARAGDPTKGYYSFDVGAWHLIALNSECANIGGCGAGSPEEQWLRSDLAAHTNMCTLAYWHRPRFSSGLHGNDDSFATWWFDLYNAHADIVLHGHDHDYERFAPQDPVQTPVADGIREFIVGTGGQEHEPFIAPAPNSQVFNSDTYGVLNLTLHSAGYDWQFVPEAGGTFTDSGTGACH
jgi:fibronectin type 3 domain-containing protein